MDLSVVSQVSSQRNVVQSTGALREQQELSQQPSAAAGTQIVLKLQVATSISEVQASAYLARICIPHRPARTIKVLKYVQQVKQSAWDACATGSGEMNPFLLWSFLNALEESGSAVSGHLC